MKWLVKFTSGLLVGALFLVTTAWVLDTTVFNAQFVKTQARETDLYTELAKELPTVTPDYVQGKLEPLLDSLEVYLREGGPAPVLDLSEVALGGPLAKPTPVFTQAQNDGVDAGTHPLLRLIKAVEGFGAIAIVVLIGLLMLFTRGYHRLTVLAKALITVAIMLLLMAALLRFAPNLLNTLIGSDKNLGTLKGPLQQLLTSIGLGVSNRFLLVGLVYGGGGLLVGITGWHLVRKAAKPLKPAPKGPGPNRE